MNMDAEQADKVLQRLWDSDVRAWHEHWVPIFRRFAHDLALDARISTGQVVLDVGTGTGIAAIEAARFAEPGGFALGIDRSGPMLTKAEDYTSKTKNVLFFKMSADHMLFPNELFDVVISNCGISYATLPRVISEVFRVLRKGGSFTFDDWHLIDVPAHRTFGDVLRRYRTEDPSAKLRVERTALATMERIGNQYLDVEAQVKELQRAGFENIQVKRRKYEIRLRGVQEYLDMRVQRAALKQELREISGNQRTKLLKELRSGLRHLVRNGRFIFDWQVIFVRAEKPA